MATLNGKFPTLLDLAVMPEMGEMGQVINLLTQMNPLLEDAPAYPCNKGLQHVTTVLTGLPSVAWGRLYKGIPASKGTRQQVVDTTGMVNTAAEVDTRLVDIYESAKEKASVRLQEASAHIEAMAQEAATAAFYHDSGLDPSLPMGFAPRFSSFSAENGSQIIDGGGSGSDNTSIWLITWGEMANHLIYPKGSQAGLQRKDRGEVPRQDANGDTFFVYREEFTWQFGLSVRNWQYVVRIANIDVSELTEDGASGADLMRLMTDAYYAHKGRRDRLGETFWYCNTTIMKFLDNQSRLKTGQNLFLTWDKYGPNAKEVLSFRNIPIRESDALLNSEDAVA